MVQVAGVAQEATLLAVSSLDRPAYRGYTGSYAEQYNQSMNGQHELLLQAPNGAWIRREADNIPSGTVVKLCNSAKRKIRKERALLRNS